MKTKPFSPFRLIVFIFLILALPASARGAPLLNGTISGARNMGPAYPVSTDLDFQNNYQWHPIITYNPDKDQYLVVWLWFLRNADLYVLLGSHVARSGQPLDTPTILVATQDKIPLYRVAYDLGYDPVTHQYLLVYESSRPGADRGGEIKGAIFNDRLDQPLKFDIWSYPNRSLENPHLSLDTNRHRFMVTWDAKNFTTLENLNIASATVPMDGGPVTNVKIFNWDNSPSMSSITYNPVKDEFLAVWAEFHESSYRWIYAARVHPETADLVMPPGIFPISQDLSPETNPVIGVNGAGHYILVRERKHDDESDVIASELDENAVQTNNSWGVGYFSYYENQPSLAVWPGIDMQYFVSYRWESRLVWAAYFYNGMNTKVNGNQVVLIDNFCASDTADTAAPESDFAISSDVAAGRVGGMIAFSTFIIDQNNKRVERIYVRAFDTFRSYIPVSLASINSVNSNSR